jgi:hypothetical protein
LAWAVAKRQLQQANPVLTIDDDAFQLEMGEVEHFKYRRQRTLNSLDSAMNAGIGE